MPNQDGCRVMSWPLSRETTAIVQLWGPIDREAVEAFAEYVAVWRRVVEKDAERSFGLVGPQGPSWPSEYNSPPPGHPYPA